MQLIQAAKYFVIHEIARSEVTVTTVGCKLRTNRCDCNPMSAPYIPDEPERLGTGTGKGVHMLCYQHHKEMLLSFLSEPAEGPVYACQEPGCLVRYDSARGYFLDTEDTKTIEQETTPHVSCSNDGQLMYLAEVDPEIRSVRVWKCPGCNESRTNEETSGGLEKKMRA
jgi:hypothetical protein